MEKTDFKMSLKVELGHVGLWDNVLLCTGEEGQDAGGLLREWYVIISRKIFNLNYAIFKSNPGDRVTYTINDISNHLCYFKL